MFKKDGSEIQLITIKYYNEHGNGEMNIDIAKFIYTHPIKEFKTLEKTIRISVNPSRTAREVIDELERVKNLEDDYINDDYQFHNTVATYVDEIVDKEKFIKKADRFIDMVKKYV